MPQWTPQPDRESPPPPPGSPGGPASGNRPRALVPVSAEDFDRRTQRRRLLIAALALAGLAGAVLTYFLYTRSRLAVESLDAGGQKLQRGLYVEAARELDRAISLKPSHAESYFLRGKAYMGVLDAARALPDFSRAIELDPTRPDYFTARAKARLEQKDFPGAIADLTRALEMDPANAEAYLRRGGALREAGEPRRALGDFSRAIDLAPAADAYFQRAATLQQLGDHGAAVADLTRAIEFSPENPSLYYARARSRAAVGDEAGARADRETGKSRDMR